VPITDPKWIDVEDPFNPPPGAVSITAARLKDMYRGINEAYETASSAAAAVEPGVLRKLITPWVIAMFPWLTYDPTKAAFNTPGTTTTPDPGTSTPVAEITIEQFVPTAGTGGDDTAALNQALAAASGKVLKGAAGKTYRHNAQVSVSLDDVTFDLNGSRLLATNENNGSLKWTGRRGTLKNGTVEGVSTVRGVVYATNILLFDGAHGMKVVDVLSKGSAGTGIFITRTRGFTLTRFRVEDSRADGVHITGGSSLGLVEDCISTRVGDDGFAVVSYALLSQSDPGMCSDIRFVNPKVRAQTVRGRGFTVVGGTNITYENVDSDGTWGPGIYVGCEPYGDNPTHGVDNVKFLGGTLRNSHSTREIANGSICIASSRSGETISNVLLQAITTYGTRSDLPFEFGFYTENGGKLTGLSLQGLKAIDGSKGALLFIPLATTDYTQSDVTQSVTGGSAAPTPTTVRITSTAPTATDVTVSWAQVVGTSGVNLSAVVSTLNGGSSASGPASGSRTFSGLAPGTYTVSLQPQNAGVAYGSPVTTTVTITGSAATSTPITSDTFTGSGELRGRSTDIGLGGSPLTWTGDSSGALAVANGRLVRGASLVNVFAGVQAGSLAVEAKVTMIALPTGDGLFLSLHRAVATSDYTVTRYEAQVIVTGALRLTKCVGGTVTVLGEGGTIGSAAAGDTVTLRYAGGRLILLVNGTVAASVADTSITTPGWCGLAIPQTTTGLTLDNFALSTSQ
jgi:hypothetical protein